MVGSVIGMYVFYLRQSASGFCWESGENYALSISIVVDVGVNVDVAVDVDTV